ncbi:hypothetical protein ABLT93_06420 [Acinetobacter soli]|uniref:hypothetical protein n=1 Tax=Acinetobacter soli TaxID=487316 RepID=UPI001D178928|nr:hypothetical protein [Acinetobacter soli]
MLKACKILRIAVTAGEAALAIVGRKVVTKYGGAAIDAAKDIRRILQNDPAKLPTVKASASGNISAKQISENGKIIDPPQEVLNKQKQLLSNPNNTQTGILREEIADSYFKIVVILNLKVNVAVIVLTVCISKMVNFIL